MLREVLEVLFDEGMITKDRKTAMDVAQTDEARLIASEEPDYS